MGSGLNRHSYIQQMKQQQQQQRRPVVQQHRQSMPPQITSPQLQPSYMIQPQPQTFIQTNAAASPQYFAANSTNRMPPTQILNYVEAVPPQTHATYNVPPPPLGQHQQFATYGTPHQQFNQTVRIDSKFDHSI